jgi:hypothetical protein
MLLLLAGATCHAGGLYAGQAPVASQSDADRAEALKNALAQVVIRVSGDPGAIAKPEIAKAVAGAERYVQQFQYQQDVATDSTGQPQTRLILVAQFDRDAVDKLLRDFALMKDAGPREQAADASAVADATPGTYHVWIAGVHSGKDYARMIGALSGNEYVRDVQVEVARGDGVQLRLATAASLPRVLNSLNAVMRVTNARPPVDGIDALLDLKP